MHNLTSSTNPFEMMLNPAVVLQAMERLDQATQLQRRICRPLDKPLPAKGDDVQAAADRAIDGTAEHED